MVGHFDSNLDALGLARDATIAVADVGTDDLPAWEVMASAVEGDGWAVMADPSDVFLFQSPESGYASSIRFRYGPGGAGDPIADAGVPVRFCMRSKVARWVSAVELVFCATNAHGTEATRLHYRMNPNGSRNLEHDGAHLLPPPNVTQ